MKELAQFFGGDRAVSAALCAKEAHGKKRNPLSAYHCFYGMDEKEEAEVRRQDRTSAFVLNLELEAIGHFGKAECAAGIYRIDFLDHVAALRVAEIQAECEAVFPFVVGADVVKSGEIFLSV